MKKTYCKPSTSIYRMVTESFIAMSMNEVLGDDGVQLSRGGRAFEVYYDDEEEGTGYSTYNVWY